jgi:putative endopeptidase
LGRAAYDAARFFRVGDIEMKKLVLLASAAAAALAAQAVFAHVEGDQATTAAATATVPAHGPSYDPWGVDLSARDTKVQPGDDFDAYANGAWSARTEIPADQGSAGVGYDVYNLSQDQLRAIIEGSAPTTPIGGMYKSFMDEARVDSLDSKPLAADLARIAAVSSKEDFARLMGRSHGAFGGSLISLQVAPDPKQPNMNVLFVGQAGLGLPDRDYYLSDTFKPQRDAYRAFIERTLANVGYANPAANADAILALEMAIAKVSWPVADRRDIDKINNPMMLPALQAYAPGLSWGTYLAAAGIARPGNMIVQEKTAIKAIADLYAATPLDTLKAWQAFQTAYQASPYLSKRFVDSRFEFVKTLSGATQIRPRWKRGASLLDSTLGEALGHAYVDRYFPPSSKAQMNELVANLKVAMASRIRGSDWMAPATKAQALTKLERMKVMVGYPDKWRDYSGLRIDPADLYGNVERSAAFEWAYSLEDLYKPVDSAKWGMTPQTVNAYNGGLENKIVFPAGILQAPYFNPRADAAVNYGAIGAVIGHEISHGFDDQGRKIDSTGAVRDWWTPEDARRFEAQAKGYGAQFDSYEPVPGMHVNGQLTMGENIADLAGILVALDAYHASLHGKPAPVIDGLTGDQRFFLAFAQAWRGKYRPDSIRQQVASDPHSPDNFRVVGPLRNVDAWYAAWNVPATAKYYLKPADRTRIW